MLIRLFSLLSGSLGQTRKYTGYQTGNKAVFNYDCGLQVNWHPVFWGMSLQYIFALLIIRTTWGYDAFQWLGDRVTELLKYSNAGAQFVFGDKYTYHMFAFQVGCPYSR